VGGLARGVIRYDLNDGTRDGVWIDSYIGETFTSEPVQHDQVEHSAPAALLHLRPLLSRSRVLNHATRTNHVYKIARSSISSEPGQAYRTHNEPTSSVFTAQ
jgi:hypothetical protein